MKDIRDNVRRLLSAAVIFTMTIGNHDITLVNVEYTNACVEAPAIPSDGKGARLEFGSVPK